MRFNKYINEAKTLQMDTVDKINTMAKNPTLKSLVKKIFSYGGKGNQGYAMARLMTTNLMNDFILDMGSAYEAGKSFNLKTELGKKKYNKVTEPFDDWFREYVTIVHKELYGK
jgi:hypothetical protein